MDKSEFNLREKKAYLIGKIKELQAETRKIDKQIKQILKERGAKNGDR